MISEKIYDLLNLFPFWIKIPERIIDKEILSKLQNKEFPIMNSHLSSKDISTFEVKEKDKKYFYKQKFTKGEIIEDSNFKHIFYWVKFYRRLR